MKRDNLPINLFFFQCIYNTWQMPNILEERLRWEGEGGGFVKNCKFWHLNLNELTTLVFISASKIEETEMKKPV